MVGANPEKRLLWHPRQQHRFAVGGNSQITLYEWAPESQEIRQVASQNDLQFMRTFAWSPDPAFDDLVAVGLSNGRIDLLRLDAARHTRRTEGGSSVLSRSGPIVSLTARTQRACLALDFCPVDSNYLLVGLDKVRNDSSLVVYDIISARSKLSLSFLPEDDDYVLPTRPGPTIPRFDITQRADQRTVQHHASSEQVSAVAYASNTNHLLLAGMSYRWLRILDIRASTPVVTGFAAKVQGIASDPYDTHRIATFGDGAVSIWDVRKLSAGPVLMFSERDASADGTLVSPQAVYSEIEFSSTRRGTLATLHRDSSFVRFWDMTSTRATEVGSGESSDGGAGESSSFSATSRLTRKSWTSGLPWTGGTPTPIGGSQISVARDSGHLVLSDTRRTKAFPKTLSSFAVVPSEKPQLTSNVMLVNRDGDLELYALHDTPKQSVWSSRGDLAISAGHTCRVFSGIMEGEAEIEQEFLQQRDREGVLEQFRQNQQQQSQQEVDVRERARSLTTTSFSSTSVVAARRRTVISPFGTQPPLFGRGDEDGFPALGTASPTQSRTRTASPASGSRRTGTAATRPSSIAQTTQSRTYSPASMRRYPYGESSTTQSTTQKSRSLSRARPNSLVSTTNSGSLVSGPNQQKLTLPPKKSSPQRARKRSRSRIRSDSRTIRGVEHVVEDDISMVMRRRCLRGYSIGNPYHNVAVTRDDDAPVPQMLSDLWTWINTAQDFLCVPTPRLHGYDFSYQGVIGIWRGLTPDGADASAATSATATPLAEPSLLLPNVLNTNFRRGTGKSRSHSRTRRSQSQSAPMQRNFSPADDLQGNFGAALSALTLRGGEREAEIHSRSGMGGLSATSIMRFSGGRPVQRQVALQLCGWSLKEEDLWANIKKWEKEGSHSRAACWLVFAQKYSEAVQVLMRSNDEAHHMMSGVLAALAPGIATSRSPELRKHYERLTIRLQDPYFRALLTHLSSGDWSEVLDEEVIPFRERLALAFQFLDDDKLSSYLETCMSNSVKRGDIDGLIVTGLTRRGLDILQSYVNRSGDVQTAAILASYVCPAKFRDARAERWIEAYRDLLDGFKLHHHRVWFDVERGGLIGDALAQSGVESEQRGVDWAPQQILIRCNYCSKPVVGLNVSPGTAPKHKPTVCANCNPSCLTLSATRNYCILLAETP
ncbi:zinc-ribbon-16 domain-containing protein [Mycena kentingensis (nom. inval.)]|nr:zinc-ribbon-16 domain-containing protein [Mycena kentingensis (nom. inval.)]